MQLGNIIYRENDIPRCRGISLLNFCGQQSFVMDFPGRRTIFCN